LAKEGLPGAADPELQAMLASALTGQGKFKEAQGPAAACLKLSRDPASRAKALLVSADIQRSLKNFPAAVSQIEEAMLLQPEGPVNAEARLLSGDILAAKQDFADAAKAYLTVAYLNDDESLAGRALEKAAGAYRRAGNAAEEQKTREELRKRQTHAAVSPSTTP
jgi:tetratricopeptide (TPR) repeat protein